MSANKELYKLYKKMKQEGKNVTLAELKAQMAGVNDATNQGETPQQSSYYGVNDSTNQSTTQQSYDYGYIARYDTSDISSTWICNGLDYKEVAKKLQDWMIAEGWKKEDLEQCLVVN